VSVLLLLIFASLAIASGFLVAFIWAVRSGQYEDTCTPAMRLLMEEGKRKANRTVEPPSGAGTPRLPAEKAPTPKSGEPRSIPV